MNVFSQVESAICGLFNGTFRHSDNCTKSNGRMLRK